MPVEHHPCGLPKLDIALGGGFSAGAIHELLADKDGAPAWTIAFRAAGHAAGRHRWVFYIDTNEDVYPPALAQAGIPLGRLVIVRTRRTTDALWVAEQSLRCQAIGSVVLSLRRLEASASRRLQLAAESGQGLGLLIRDRVDGQSSFAASRVRIEPLSGNDMIRRLRITVMKSRAPNGGCRGHGIGNCDTSIRPVNSPAGVPFVVEVPDAADSVPAHAAFGDTARPARRRATS